MLKKKISLFTAIILFGLMLCNIFLALNGDAAIAAENTNNLITQEFVTYRGNSKYTGETIGSHIEADDFADLEITDNGGTHTDGDGNTVFSNYVIFKIDRKRNIPNITSIIVNGIDNIFIKPSLGVVNAFHTLFNNSMIFYNLHKFFFIFRSNATKCIIIKIYS